MKFNISKYSMWLIILKLINIQISNLEIWMIAIKLITNNIEFGNLKNC